MNKINDKLLKEFSEETGLVGTYTKEGATYHTLNYVNWLESRVGTKVKPEDYEVRVDIAISGVKEVLLKANAKHPPLFNSMHEGSSVLREEFEELWEDVRKDDLSHSMLEAKQVAAMAIKYLVSMSYLQDQRIGTK